VTIDHDEELARRAAGGDHEAFRELVTRYQDRVYTLARRFGNSRLDAEDVTQDTFLRAWRALKRFRGDSRLSTWLYRIASRRAWDVAAGRRSLDASEMALDEEITVARATVDADSPVVSAAERLRVERVIADLTPMQRAVVTLFYYQDQSVKEVALVLGLPEGTVKTHLYRARATLRRQLERLESHRKRGAN